MFIHWDAADDKKIFAYNYQATKESIARAMKNEPKIDDGHRLREDGHAPVRRRRRRK